MSKRRVAWLRMYNGRMVDAFNVTPDDIVPENFIHACSQINRYTGNCKFPYPVNQHQLLLYLCVPKRLKRAALVHDITEHWFSDVPSPVKIHMKYYKRKEKDAELVVMQKYGITHAQMADLKQYDIRIRIDEKLQLFDVQEETHHISNDAQYVKGLGVEIKEMTWRQVKAAYGDAFYKEFGRG